MSKALGHTAGSNQTVNAHSVTSRESLCGPGPRCVSFTSGAREAQVSHLVLCAPIKTLHPGAQARTSG